MIPIEDREIKNVILSLKLNNLRDKRKCGISFWLQGRTKLRLLKTELRRRVRKGKKRKIGKSS
jgi:hypothetical protein